ncbi:MAG: hypothetical protein QHH04_00910 [Methanolinea sp.]|nr:hypothetical protein [Methanolinea sp.]
MGLRTVLPLLVFLLVATGAAAGAISIDATPHDAYIGDRVHINGTTDGKNLIAVFLFVTGPGLDRAGVTLENMHLRAGTGYFTSAYVNPDGTFAYEWDTSFIVGNLVPGKYRIYAVNVPLNLARLTDTDSISVSSTEITFRRPPPRSLPGFGPEVLFPFFLIIAFLCVYRRERVGP